MHREIDEERLRISRKERDKLGRAIKSFANICMGSLLTELNHIL